MTSNVFRNRLLLGMKVGQARLKHSKIAPLIKAIVRTLSAIMIFIACFFFLCHLIGLSIAALTILFVLERVYGIQPVAFADTFQQRGFRFA